MYHPNLEEIPVDFGVTILALLAVTAGYFLGFRKHAKRLPPGPVGNPVIGIHLGEKSVKDLEEWAHEHGDIMHLHAFGQGGIVFLNSHKSALDLLDRRGNEYRYRPKFIAINEFLTRGLFLTSTTDDDLWRRMRRVGHECMNKSAIRRYDHIQQREALIFTENLLKDSTNWYREVHRLAISGILSACYDIPPTLNWEDPLVVKLDEFDKHILYAGYPGSYLVEYFSWLKYLPAIISPWKKRANAIFDEYNTLFKNMFREVGKRMEEGDAMPGMVGHSIRQQERLGLSDVEASWIPAAFTNGGLATAESMLWFFVAMTVYPDKQRKCHEELEAVIGRSRVPTLADRDQLPYMRATIRELLRWRPQAPVGVPRVSKEDIVHDGYVIPKGTSCYGHIWTINRDPKLYGPDVEHFNPDRFIGIDGKLLPAAPDTKDGHSTYGFGPRLCPGRHYANETMLITFAQLLWATTVTAIDDKTGKPFTPDPYATVGVTIRPVPFACDFKPRFPEAADLVSQAKEVLG